jgi:hypothetical protein
MNKKSILVSVFVLICAPSFAQDKLYADEFPLDDVTLLKAIEVIEQGKSMPQAPKQAKQ